MQRFGTHVSILPTIQDTFNQCLDQRMPCFQIFLGSPHSYFRRVVPDADVAACADLDATLFVHSPYSFSLINPEVYSKCRSALTHELRFAHRMGCRCGGVVVHPGSSKDTAQGLAHCVDSIRDLYLQEDLGTLLLENSAGQGTTLPTLLEQCASVLNTLPADVASRVGVCLDTCHIFAAGTDDLSDPMTLRRKVDETIGLERLRLIHLNDSVHGLGARKDRHAALGAGKIWTTKEKLSNFLSAFDGVPMVTETGSWEEDLAFAAP